MCPVPTSRDEKYTLTRNVVFVGFMGAGKTTLARRIARNLGLISIDADTYFSHDVGMGPGAFMQAYGEPAFRAQEAAVLRELLSREPAFISCGGGVVETPENRELLRNEFVVYLRVSADEAKARIRNYTNRPLFGDIEQARALEARRAPWYEEVADITLETGSRPVVALADTLAAQLVERGVLCPQPK